MILKLAVGISLSKSAKSTLFYRRISAIYQKTSVRYLTVEPNSASRSGPAENSSQDFNFDQNLGKKGDLASCFAHNLGKKVPLRVNLANKLSENSFLRRNLWVGLHRGKNLSKEMEVEVKIRLPSAEVHGKVAKILEKNHIVTHFQENTFFDGANKELSSKRVTLRLRFYNNDEKCVVTVKGRAVMADGIGKATEEEEEIEPALGRACVDDPLKLLSLNCALLHKVREKYSCQDFVCLGGFRNVRMVFSWNNHHIELDETKFPFGTQYEIECETENPEKLRSDLEDFLKANEIPYAYSQATKFGIFRAGKLPEF